MERKILKPKKPKKELTLDQILNGMEEAFIEHAHSILPELYADHLEDTISDKPLEERGRYKRFPFKITKALIMKLVKYHRKITRQENQITRQKIQIARLKTDLVLMQQKSSNNPLLPKKRSNK